MKFLFARFVLFTAFGAGPGGGAGRRAGVAECLLGFWLGQGVLEATPVHELIQELSGRKLVALGWASVSEGR